MNLYRNKVQFFFFTMSNLQSNGLDYMFITTNSEEKVRLLLALLKLQIERPLLPEHVKRQLSESIYRLQRSLEEGASLHFL